jgi:hypothetical protein
MSENKQTKQEDKCPMFKRIARRAKRREELQQLKKLSPPSDLTIDPYICLSCMWLFDCDSPRFGGCEEYEKAMSTRA